MIDIDALNRELSAEKGTVARSQLFHLVLPISGSGASGPNTIRSPYRNRLRSIASAMA
jgi:hypothetical protein